MSAPYRRTLCQLCVHSPRRLFSTTPHRCEVRDINELPDRIHPIYTKCADSKLLTLSWPTPPRNIMFVKKPGVDMTRDALVEFAEHITKTYPSTSIILEPTVAESLQHRLSNPVYTLPPPSGSSPFPYTQSTDPRTPPHSTYAPPWTPPPTSPSPPSPDPYHMKTDALITLGGDGTILYASSLFSTSRLVPPLLSFSMGTLGFLGEHRYSSAHSAFKLLYTSRARILKRNRLRTSTGSEAHAMNEISLHRGRDPHLTILEIYVNGQFLTEAVADGIIVSTPTGSTAYSLSSGGSILHPSVASLLITPICPRSLSFRPLVLPDDAEITLRLSTKNRGSGVDVSVDGRTWGRIGVGEEVRVWLERVEGGGEGGIPCVMRKVVEGAEDDSWVGGLNGLLKFNYPFGEEE